jgi:hypothetical protein
MSSIPEQVSNQLGQLAAQLVSAVPAANADRLSEQHPPHAALTETASGWDSYDVWRRFIKDARARRHPGQAPDQI